jgi:hypothetical protein
VSTLTEIAAGLADRLRTIAAFDQNVLTVVRRPAVYPAAILIPPAIPDYGLALDGQGAEFVIPVLVLVGTAEAESQGSLFPFLDWAGPSSIPAAVEADRTLGGLAVDAHARSAHDPPGLQELPDGTLAYGSYVYVGIFAT